MNVIENLKELEETLDAKTLKKMQRKSKGKKKLK